MEELQQEQYLVSGQEPQYSSIQNIRLDYLPHEWNDPGARYLRKSISSVGSSSTTNPSYSPSSFFLNRSLDHAVSTLSSGKKTMLEPLQNYETRKQFRKQLMNDYRHMLDEQVANKVVKEKDILEGNDAKMLESFVRNNNFDSPIFYQGSVVGDPKYDINLNRFLQKEREYDRSFNIENYDDDAFKRRDLEHIRNKELVKHSDSQHLGTSTSPSVTT